MRSVHVLAGIPSLNNALYWRIRFLVGDPTALVIVHDGGRVERGAVVERDAGTDGEVEDREVVVVGPALHEQTVRLEENLLVTKDGPVLFTRHPFYEEALA